LILIFPKLSIPSLSLDECFNDLIRGRFDAVITDFTGIKSYLERENSELMIVEGVNLGNEQYAVGFRHGSDMVNSINNMMSDLIQDGTMYSFSEKYGINDLFSTEEAKSTISDTNLKTSNSKTKIYINKSIYVLLLLSLIINILF